MIEIDTKSYENNLMQQRRGSILINYKLGQLIRQMVELETEKQNLLTSPRLLPPTIIHTDMAAVTPVWQTAHTWGPCSDLKHLE